MWPFDNLGDTVAQITNLPWAIAGIFIHFFMMVAYPIVLLISIVQNAFIALWTPLAGFVNALIGIPNLLIGILNALFVGTLPAIWIGLIMIELFIVLGLRIYSFLKDVEILGNKI